MKIIEPSNNSGKPKSGETTARAFVTVGRGSTLSVKLEPEESRACALDTPGESGTLEEDWKTQGTRKNGVTNFKIIQNNPLEKIAISNIFT